MNAGSRLGEVVDQLCWVEVVQSSGEVERLPAAQLGMGYRTSDLPPGAVVIRAAMSLTDEDPAVHQQRVRTFLDRRRRHSRLIYRNVGRPSAIQRVTMLGA